MDISMDIHEKSVDMDMDVIFHIHDNPAYLALRRASKKKYRPMQLVSVYIFFI